MPGTLTGSPITDQLAPLAAELVRAVRVGDPVAVAEVFASAPVLTGGRCDPAVVLAVLCAAMVDDDDAPMALLAAHAQVAEFTRLRDCGMSADTAERLAATRVEGAT